MNKKYKQYIYFKLDLPQIDWTPHCHTVWKWSLIGHCTIWVHPRNCLHLSHWHPALKGQVQGGLDRGAGLHQPRQHTGEKEKQQHGQKGLPFFHMQIRQWNHCAKFENNGGIKTRVKPLLKTCICITYKPNLLNTVLLLLYWSLTQQFLIVRAQCANLFPLCFCSTCWTLCPLTIIAWAPWLVLASVLPNAATFMQSSLCLVYVAAVPASALFWLQVKGSALVKQGLWWKEKVF